MEQEHPATWCNQPFPTDPNRSNMFQNASRFGIEQSQFTNVQGNLNIQPIVAHPASAPQSTGGIGVATIAAGTRGNHGSHSQVTAPVIESESEVYRNQLLRRKRGFPLYVPGPQRNLPAEYQLRGLSIGDVGRVTPEGGFDFFFNIYLPAHHPINVNYVPENFYPLPCYDLRDVSWQDYEPGNYVSSHSVRLCESESFVGEFPGGSFLFGCEGPNGAVLALPHGSHLEKLEDIEHARRYAARNAESWYRYVNETRGRGLTNGSLYLVTGWEKSQSGGMASFQDAVWNNFQISFTPTALDSDAGYKYRFNRCPFTHTKQFWAPAQGDDHTLNHTIFIHGFSISIGEGIWGRLFGNVAIRQITDFQLQNSPSDFVPFGSQGSVSSWFLGFFGGNVGTGGKQYMGRNGEKVNISEISPSPEVFHPAQPIHKFILSKAPNATVIITHDDDWRDILYSDGTESTVQDAKGFLNRLSEQFVIQKEDGTFFLKSKSDAPMNDLNCGDTVTSHTMAIMDQNIGAIGEKSGTTKDAHEEASQLLPSPIAGSMLQLLSPRPLFATQDDNFPRTSALQDVLQPGDVVGEGIELQDEILCLVKLVSEVKKDTEPAHEFEVVRRLGSGSGAIVYLALEHSEPSGREYAIKCIRKANLDDEALKAQLDEITIHQSLHSHPNIVTLYRTLETSSFLLLLLERVPGQDLFYFIEEARNFFEPPASAYSLAILTSPQQQLSRARLSLISSMFSQMCDAVAACHAQQVFHRDIKPENFIVNEEFTEVDGRIQRNVIVKLTDFGLSTTDVESSDMDCGRPAYMSYECRNNIARSYRPRAADVWSLGVLLINMIYHRYPWTDTKVGECQSFGLFRQQPVTFFMQRFVGMTRPVAEHFAYKVFNILDDPTDDSQRISAADFGLWIKNLPDLLGNHSPDFTAFNSASTIRNPIKRSRSISSARSFGPAFEKPEAFTLPTDILDTFGMGSETSAESHSASIGKRRKRGLRKVMGSLPPVPGDDTLENLAISSQTLAREISRASSDSSPPSPRIQFDSKASGIRSVPTWSWMKGFKRADLRTTGNAPPGDKAAPEATPRVMRSGSPTGWLSMKSASTARSGSSSSSAGSASTTATSMSGNSARSATGNRWASGWTVERGLPANIRTMSGGTMEDQVAPFRFTSATERQPTTVHWEPQELSTISETQPVSQKFRRRDLNIRTTVRDRPPPYEEVGQGPTSLDDAQQSPPTPQARTSTPDPSESSHELEGDVPKTPSKTQVNTLAKMLSALRR